MPVHPNCIMQFITLKGKTMKTLKKTAPKTITMEFIIKMVKRPVLIGVRLTLFPGPGICQEDTKISK